MQVVKKLSLPFLGEREVRKSPHRWELLVFVGRSSLTPRTFQWPSFLSSFMNTGLLYEPVNECHWPPVPFRVPASEGRLWPALPGAAWLCTHTEKAPRVPRVCQHSAPMGTVLRGICPVMVQRPDVPSAHRVGLLGVLPLGRRLWGPRQQPSF